MTLEKKQTNPEQEESSWKAEGRTGRSILEAMILNTIHFLTFVGFTDPVVRVVAFHVHHHIESVKCGARQSGGHFGIDKHARVELGCQLLTVSPHQRLSTARPIKSDPGVAQESAYTIDVENI